MTRDRALAILKVAAPELRRDFGVTRIGIFGSVARDEAGPDSDIDLTAEFAPGEGPGLRLFDLEARLSELLGRPAFIAGLDRMNAYIRAMVERDLVYA
jgi:predicted nucleotidyltransferase